MFVGSHRKASPLEAARALSLHPESPGPALSVARCFAPPTLAPPRLAPIPAVSVTSLSMKPFLRLTLLAVLPIMLPAQNSTAPADVSPTPQPLASAVFDWEKLTVTATTTGERRNVFDGPTSTLDQAHCHITTLNPGTTSGEPRRHLQEEVIIVKTGRVEVSIDGRLETAGPGSVFFLASNAVTRLRNAGNTPATYYVIYYRTPLTPKN